MFRGIIMNGLTLSFVLLICFAFVSVEANGGVCITAPSAANYTKGLYEGFWYEIAKIQTRGGAFFERNCVCTSIGVAYSPLGDSAIANQTCRTNGISGPRTTVYGALNATTQPGRFIETIYPGAYNSVNYTVIELGPDFAVEYDCGSALVGVNYCLHYMSRYPTMDPYLLDELVDATSYLNVNKLALKMTTQDGCW